MAIKIIKENSIRKKITCSCGSILEYGNADLQTRIKCTGKTALIYKAIKCPLCGADIKCDWIKK